ncbi:peroxisomal membrane protein 11A [Andrographis paniculata]|uniref:peroxisomal membrane protein 11A n=1 Tax=Andrographis paniculata TaxID=175694 RepID=UPI0021E99E28|nr:peroxisomal membrane protein 11A [Andrographis paniculata]
MASAAAAANRPEPHKSTTAKDRDFLTHLELYLAKRDGVDKLLKLSRYAAKFVLSSGVLAGDLPIAGRLKSFESSVGVSRKAFRLGKFVQNMNALRATDFAAGHFHRRHALSAVAGGGEGIYYFIEQFVWLGKAGLINKRYLLSLQKCSAWFEFIGYFGCIALKMIELRKIDEDQRCLKSSIEVSKLRGIACGNEEAKLRKLRKTTTMKRLSIVQDLADGLMALADIRDGRGRLSAPLLVSSAGLLSALISTHKNWVSC